jgi:dTDP-4-amino-4,6-dideoxygalactose transaminase
MIEYENLSKLNQPFFKDFKQGFENFLNKGWFILGDEVNNFEVQFSDYIQSKYFVGVANGLDALTLSLNVFDFEKGSEVIVPSNTYIATILAILNAGLKPIFVEPDLGTYNIDPFLIEEKISNKTVAIMVVHLYGKCCDMGRINILSKKYDLKVIEDCAQAHGAMVNNVKAGNLGDLGAFSFYPTKNLGALGDAGGISVNNEYYYNKVKKMRNYGSEKKYYNDLIGTNSRLDEVQAIFLNIKLKQLDNITLHKRKLANLYLNYLKEDFVKPVVDSNFYDVYHIFNIRHPKRDNLKKYLFDSGVITEIHYPVPPHEQDALKTVNGIGKNYSISKLIHDTTLSLPISLIHSENDVMKVIEVMNKF